MIVDIEVYSKRGNVFPVKYFLNFRHLFCLYVTLGWGPALAVLRTFFHRVHGQNEYFTELLWARHGAPQPFVRTDRKQPCARLYEVGRKPFKIMVLPRYFQRRETRATRTTAAITKARVGSQMLTCLYRFLSRVAFICRRPTNETVPAASFREFRYHAVPRWPRRTYATLLTAIYTGFPCVFVRNAGGISTAYRAHGHTSHYGHGGRLRIVTETKRDQGETARDGKFSTTSTSTKAACPPQPAAVLRHRFSGTNDAAALNRMKTRYRSCTLLPPDVELRRPCFRHVSITTIRLFRNRRCAAEMCHRVTYSSKPGGVRSNDDGKLFGILRV